MAGNGCTPTNLVHPMYGFGKQDKNAVVIARVSEKINYLTELTTKNYMDITVGTLLTYDSLALPEDLIRCNEKRCHMSGTLFVTPEEGVAGVKYQIKGDYSLATFGYNFIYLTYIGNDTLEVKATISDYDDVEQLNSYTYVTTVQQSGLAVDDYSVAQFDLANFTKIDGQTGTGWIPSSKGITVTYTVTHLNKEDAYVAEPIGFSSIKTVACKDELHKSDNVLLSCISSFAPDTSIDATDATCFGSGYDPDSIEITYSLEATTRSANDWWINPLEHRGDKTVAGIPVTRPFRVKEKEVNGVTFGHVDLSDLYPDCNNVIISLGEDCNGIYLEPLQLPTVAPVDTTEFITVNQPTDPDFGSVYINKKYIGKDVLITYDVEMEVEHIVGDDSKLDSFEVEFIVPKKRANGTKIEYVKFYGIVTSLGEEYTPSEETVLSLEITLVRRDGKFYDKFIVDNVA